MYFHFDSHFECSYSVCTPARYMLLWFVIREYLEAVWFSSLSSLRRENNIFMCHGGGACARLRCNFDIVFLVVNRMCRGWDLWVRVTRRECSKACKTWRRRLWDSWIARLLEVQNGIVLWWTRWMTLTDQMLDTRAREVGHMVRQWESMAQPELAAWKCAVVLRPDHAVRLECDCVATSLSGVFPEARCKVGSADDGGLGIYVGHERYGDSSWRHDGCQRDGEGVTQKVLSMVLEGAMVLRERVVATIPKCRKMQRDRDMGQSKGSRIGDSKASKRGLAEIRRVDMASVDPNALEIGSVLLLDRNCEILSGIESCAAVTVFALAWCEELQVLFGSECSKGERKAPRSVILVCESENDRDRQNVDGSVRDERHEPRCVFHLLQQGYLSVCNPTRTVESNWSWSQTVDLSCQSSLFCTTRKNGNSCLVSSLSELEQIEDMSITIANSEYTRAHVRSLVVGGDFGSRDVFYPIPKVGLLEEWPGVSGGREKTQREELR